MPLLASASLMLTHGFHCVIRFLDIDISDDEDDPIKEYSELPMTHDEIINNCGFDSKNMITPSSTMKGSAVQLGDNVDNQTSHMSQEQHLNNSTQSPINMRVRFKTVLKLLEGALVGFIEYIDFENYVNEQNADTSTAESPTIAGVAKKLALRDGTILDEKQYITYEIICCTFLLDMLKETHTNFKLMQATTSNAIEQLPNSIQKLEKQLHARGGKDQLRLFLTGPAGAGKTTALKAAEHFCFEFCSFCGIPWYPTTFFYTAYTGAAASAFGGRTIVTASGMSSGTLNDTQIKEWERCKILVIDEISFMSENELIKLDNRLRRYKDRNKPYGGYSVIFGGDFRQLQNNTEKKQLLYSRDSQRKFETNLNGIIILDNEHRFKNDKEFGRLLKRFWAGDLTREDRDLINSRKVNGTTVKIPDILSCKEDWSYACPYNKERNAITASIFKKHVENTHPMAGSHENPPQHTLIIEGYFQTKPTNDTHSERVRNVIRHRIVTSCGDNDIEYGNRKKADPSLCLYHGIHLICVTDNKNMNQNPPRGNGTVVKFISAKIKHMAPSYKVKIYNGRKVWTVNAIDVEWLNVELVDNHEELDNIQKEIDATRNRTDTNKRDQREKLDNLQKLLEKKTQQRRFQIKPEKRAVTINLKVCKGSMINKEYHYHMLLFPVNICTALTGHKLQGRSKDIVIISSWPRRQSRAAFINWEYVVLSRVRSLNGLYLFEKLQYNTSYAPTEEFTEFIKRAKRMERKLISSREQNIKNHNRNHNK